MKIVRNQYRVHLERNPRYECPPMIPARDWKSLVEYGKERALRNEGKLPLGTGRLSDTSKATKEIQAKIGQHKVGPGGYSNLAARIVDRFK